MTKKPGLKGRAKSIKAAMAAAASSGNKSTLLVESADQIKTAKASSPVVAAALSAAQKLPKDPDDIRVLEGRAEIYARPPSSKRSTFNGESYIHVGLGGINSYGIPFSHSDEIAYASEITPVPGTPAHIAGVINLRGKLLTVIDLKAVFGQGTLPEDEDRRIVVVSGEDLRFGILVARVDGSKSYNSEDLSPSIGGSGRFNSSLVRGIHIGKIAILDIAALMQDPAIIVDQSK